MKKTLSPQKIIEEYIEAGIVLTETTLDGNYKRGNAVAKRLQKAFILLEQDKELAEQVLMQVMNSKIDKARSMAAADSLRMRILVEYATCVLEEIAMRDDIIGFGSQMTLRIWRGEVPGKTL